MEWEEEINVDGEDADEEDDSIPRNNDGTFDGGSAVEGKTHSIECDLVRLYFLAVEMVLFVIYPNPMIYFMNPRLSSSNAAKHSRPTRIIQYCIQQPLSLSVSIRQLNWALFLNIM